MSREFDLEHSVRSDLLERRWVRLHVTLIGLVTFASLWGFAHALMRIGVDSMALRHGIALIGAYLIYLGLLWLWARWLLSREESYDGLDLVDLPSGDLRGSFATSARHAPAFRSGGGGDFGGGGATGSFDSAGEGLSSAGGKVTSAAAEAIGSADEGAIVLVPVALVVGAAALLGMALGFVVFGLFGAEVLIGVAVEIAFASAGGALAFKARREGWLSHAVRRTIVPMGMMLVATVAAGLAIAHWLPGASTLPQAMRLLFG